jgi:3-phytase
MISRFLAASALLLVSACAASTAAPEAESPALRYPAIDVPAAAETAAVATLNADAADDPAIFARADATPFTFAGKRVGGVILGTDKKAGLYVFSADTGERLQFLADGKLNNVDLRAEGDGFLAAASDRGRMGVALYRFTGEGDLKPAGFLKSDVAEPYGFCMGRLGDAMVAVLVAKDGQVRVYDLATAGGGEVTGRERMRFAVGSQSEGCVVDDATGALYIGEEDVALWRYDLRAAPGTRTQVAAVARGQLVADIEGVTLLRDGGETYLIASSQGDDAFAVWTVNAVPGQERYVGRFRVAPANGVDGVSGTDGVDAWGGAIGRYGHGLVVMQDGDNGAEAQNFKLVDWATIKAALIR